MKWNYRIIKEAQGWGLFKVYYYDDDNVPISSAVDPEFGYFENRLELFNALSNMFEAKFYPTLTCVDGSGFNVLEYKTKTHSALGEMANPPDSGSGV